MIWGFGIVAVAGFAGLAMNDARRFEIEYGLLVATTCAMAALNLAQGIGPVAMLAGGALFLALIWIVTRITGKDMGQGDWVLIPAIGAMLGLANLILFYTGFAIVLAAVILRARIKCMDWRRAPVPAALPTGLAMIPVAVLRIWQAPIAPPLALANLAWLGILAGVGWTIWDIKFQAKER